MSEDLRNEAIVAEIQLINGSTEDSSFDLDEQIESNLPTMTDAKAVIQVWNKSLCINVSLFLIILSFIYLKHVHFKKKIVHHGVKLLIIIKYVQKLIMRKLYN